MFNLCFGHLVFLVGIYCLNCSKCRPLLFLSIFPISTQQLETICLKQFKEHPFVSQKESDRKWSLRLVVLVGFEPTQTEPESGVLPLHHRTIRHKCGAKLLLFSEPPKLFKEILKKGAIFLSGAES